jgi:hypothetical protein
MRPVIARIPVVALWALLLLPFVPISPAGAAPPEPPTGFAASYTRDGYWLTWVNPSLRTDGTSLDDFGGVRLYRNGALIATLGRPLGAAGAADEYFHAGVNLADGWLFGIESFDRGTPPESSARVAADMFQVLPSPIPITIPWKSEAPVTVELSYVNISHPPHATFSTTVPWLLVAPSTAMVYPGAPGRVLVTTNSWTLAPGPHVGAVSVNGKWIPLTLHVLPAPPAVSIQPEALEIDRFVGRGPARTALLVANGGYDDLEVQLDSDAAWLRPFPGGQVLPREEVRSLPLRIDTCGLPPGTHVASLRLSSNDPVRPEVFIPVSVRITARAPEVAPADIRIDEVAFRCPDGDGRVQFALRVEDRTGTLLFIQSDLFTGRADGDPWPTSVPWLLGSPEFGAAAGAVPDLLLAGMLDPLGGTITLEDTATPGRILHRFTYGLGGPPDAPPPGASLHWSDGQFVTGEASPENSRGVLAELDCPCPRAEFDFSLQRTYSSEPADARNYSPGLGGSSEAAYDMPAGSWSVNGYGATSRLTIEESFVIDGVPTGIPVSFRVLYDASGSAFGEQNSLGIPHSGSITASLADDQGRSSSLSLSASASTSPSSRTISRALHLDLARTALEPFRLTMVSRGSGTVHARPGGGGSLRGSLRFQGLPPGARVRSCRGFEAREELPDRTPPEITVVPNPAALWPPNHRLVPVSVNVTVTDDSDPEPVVRLVSIVSSQPDAGGGKGDEAGDVQGAELGSDDRNVSLRAERSGNGDERVYTLTYEAEDFFGNVASASANVTVGHDGRSTTAAGSGEVQVIADPASSAIRFVFEATESVRGALRLFDAAGRRIAEVPFTASAAGVHEVLWNGESERGGRVAAGLYLGRLDIENQGKAGGRTFKVIVVR